MRHSFRCVVLLATAFTLGTSVHADLPLTIEDLITDQGRTKLNLSLIYLNSELSARSLYAENQDVLVGSVSLHYGLTGKTEIYGRGSYLYSHGRTNSITKTTINIDNRFLDAWAGINYQFKQDDATPALLGFAEVAAVENHQGTLHSLRSWDFGLTTYRAIDPVVFSLATDVRLNLSRKSGDTRYCPGHILSVNPSVDFAANDRVTFSGGLRWNMQLADRLARKMQDDEGETIKRKSKGYNRTSTDLKLSVSYGLSEDNVVHVTLLSGISSNRGSSLQLNWRHTF